MSDSIALFRKIMIANELGGNMSAALRFSDPDGIHTGKSGYSFGVVQFDINNNPSAILCLRECGFTTDEVLAIKAQTCRIQPMNAKLKAAAAVVDKWDERQIFECLSHPQQLCRDSGVKFASNEAFFRLADYHNQFNMSKGGKMHRYLCSLRRPVDSEDILKLILGTIWGKKRPDDVVRRYNNIVRIMKSENIT